MEKKGDEIHLTATEARGAAPANSVRYILFFGILLVVIAFAVIVFTGVLRSPQGSHSDAISNQAPHTEGPG